MVEVDEGWLLVVRVPVKFCRTLGSQPLPQPERRGSVDNHDAGNEFLHAMKVKIDGRAFRIGFGDDAKSVLEMLDISAFFESFQDASSRGTHSGCLGDWP